MNLVKHITALIIVAVCAAQPAYGKSFEGACNELADAEHSMDASQVPAGEIIQSLGHMAASALKSGDEHLLYGLVYHAFLRSKERTLEAEWFGESLKQVITIRSHRERALTLIDRHLNRTSAVEKVVILKLLDVLQTRPQDNIYISSILRRLSLDSDKDIAHSAKALAQKLLTP